MEPKYIITFTQEVHPKEFFRQLKKLVGKRYFEENFLKIEDELLNGYVFSAKGYEFKIEQNGTVDNPDNPAGNPGL